MGDVGVLLVDHLGFLDVSSSGARASLEGSSWVRVVTRDSSTARVKVDSSRTGRTEILKLSGKSHVPPMGWLCMKRAD
jgi:hypothetical protein